MPHDVFISYATEDKITADAVCFGMEKRGIRCWMAPRDILPSDNFDDAIIRAIDAARVMVVIFSSNIFQSQYVKSEVEYAFSRNLIIAPFRIEAITPEGGMKLYLGRKHWLDAMTPPLENHIQKLSSTILGMLAAPVPGSAEAVPTQPVPGPDSTIQASAQAKIPIQIPIQIQADGSMGGRPVNFWGSGLRPAERAPKQPEPTQFGQAHFNRGEPAHFYPAGGRRDPKNQPYFRGPFHPKASDPACSNG